MFLDIGHKRLFYLSNNDMKAAIFLISLSQGGELGRAARFLLVHDTQTGKNVPNEYKMYQKVIKYPKSP
jgi:hypothetical protein